MSDQVLEYIQTDDAQARRNAMLLGCGQALGGAIAAIIIATGGHVGAMLATDRSLATLPVSVFILGTAFSTLPANLAMRKLGRRGGYYLSSGIGIVAILIAAYGVYFGNFYIFAFGTFATGAYWAFVQSYRFAATDIASEQFKSKAISWVMMGGLASAVVGPQTIIWTKDLIPTHVFAATYLAGAVLIAISMLIVTRIRVPRPNIVKGAPSGRPLGEIAGSRRFVVAVFCGVVSYSVMTFVMTASPLAIVGGGHSQAQAALGIQWHIVAMYLPSFFAGNLIDRYGKIKIVIAGMLFLTGASITALSGDSIANYWGALVLLGLGWNFGYIGATAMVTDSYSPAEMNKVQGLNDFMIFGLNAAASLSAGVIYFYYGWEMVAGIVLPAIGLCLGLLIWISVRRRRMQRA
jgi:MFS family permease